MAGARIGENEIAKRDWEYLYIGKKHTGKLSNFFYIFLFNTITHGTGFTSTTRIRLTSTVFKQAFVSYIFSIYFSLQPTPPPIIANSLPPPLHYRRSSVLGWVWYSWEGGPRYPKRYSFNIRRALRLRTNLTFRRFFAAQIGEGGGRRNGKMKNLTHHQL